MSLHQSSILVDWRLQ